ncbi:MAG: 5,6-dimethylbenzimidazole synthase [Gammaproteobacteria bacterium]|nr:5,6-dimethylbenzimidazole synthase [Gammaproteobacteria bacterium]MDH5660123.1 5,6-dimethylbenzimidazole synthase [Gammaproteobacteria bacterium]
MNKRYNKSDIDAIYRVIEQRRDMRHFTSEPVDEALLERLLKAAHFAPSVGFMQPWRFIRITDKDIRQKMHGLVEEERIATANAMGERDDEFMKLKVEGILDCGEVLVVSLMEDRDKNIFGRRTLPEMDLASVSCAIQNMWLAARAEGLGLGWVSIFDPNKLSGLLNIPPTGKPVAILCLGHVDEFYDKPMLEKENWAKRQLLETVVFENTWQNK